MAIRGVKIQCNAALSSVVLFCCVGLGPAPAGEPEVLLESVQKVYSDGKWNGRPAIEFWQGQYYIFFRSGFHHGLDNGGIIALRSKSDAPRDWSTVSVIDGPDNEAEVHVLATPQRLFAYLVVEDPVSGEVTGSMVIYTDDGVHWSEPQPVHSSSPNAARKQGPQAAMAAWGPCFLYVPNGNQISYHSSMFLTEIKFPIIWTGHRR